MRSVLSLSWRLLRLGTDRSRLSAALVLLAVAASTTLLMFAVATNHAFGERASREAWRYPVRAVDHATAIEALSTDHVRGEPIAVVDLAALDRSRAPVPPGMARFPKPGEVWVSPALARLIQRLPADELGNRFPGRSAGELGSAALVRPGELVAVVGHRPDDPAMTAPRIRGQDGIAPPTRITAYASAASATATVDTPNDTAVYLVLAKVATALMVVPLLVFGGAAARLTVARRDRRLAALRLVGATPAQVVGMTVAEAVLTALSGAVIGIAAYTALMPALAQIPIRGGGWFVCDLWPGPLWVLAVLVGVPLLVGVSAVVGLRRVVVSPLGVARRETPPRLRAVRAVVALAVLIAFPIAAKMGGHLGVGIVVSLLGLAFLGLNLLGPWVVGVLGRIVAASASRPARLLAGRRLIDDPRAAWRTVSGLALVGFVAGFLAMLNPSQLSTAPDSPRTTLTVTVPADRVQGVEHQVRERLAGRRLNATVSVGDAFEPSNRNVEVATRDSQVDQVRTALAGSVPGHAFTSAEDRNAAAVLLGTDIRTGVLVVFAVCYLIAIVSAGIMAVSSVLDRRQIYAMLRLAGTPLAVLRRARLAETLIPLAVMGGGSLLGGLLCASPFALASPIAPYGLLLLGAFVAIGTVGVIAANGLAAPLLRTVSSDPAPQTD